MKQVALVVGGSGMLSGLCLELAKHYDVVGVVGRTDTKMRDLLDTKNIIPIYVDYSSVEFEKALQYFAQEYGRPELVVAWVHDYASNSILIAARYCNENFFEITGHSGSEKAHPSHFHEEQINTKHVKYHRVILGKAINRWLTDHEISQGVSQAIKSSSPEYIVGNL